MTKRILIPLQIVLMLVTLGGSLYAAFAPANNLLNWYNIDDAFYYYKVAQNVLTGHGFTFDQINLTNGFHPLWMVVCLGVFWLSKFSLILPLRVLVVVSGLFNALTALVLFRFLKRHLNVWAALGAALILGLYRPIYEAVIAHGMESAISMFFIVLLLSRAAKYLEANPEQTNYKNLAWLGLIGALTILARLDNVFVVGMIGFYVLLKPGKGNPMLLLDAVLISMAVFLSWLIRLGSEGVIHYSSSFYPMLLVSIVVTLTALHFAGLYRERKEGSRKVIFIRTAIAFAAAFLLEYLILFGLSKLGILKLFSNSLLFLNAGIGLILVLGAHLLKPYSGKLAETNPFAAFWGWVKRQWKPVLLGGMAYAAPIAVLIGAYMLTNRIVFGSFTPVSGQIKHWWSSMANTVYAKPATLLSALGLGTNEANGPWSLITSPLFNAAEQISGWLKSTSVELVFGLLVLISVGGLMAIMAANRGRLLNKFMAILMPAMLLGTLLQITYYTSTGYTHTRTWYWVAEMVTLVMLASLVLDWLFSLMEDRKWLRGALAPALAVLLAALLIFGHIRFVKGFVPYRVAEGQENAYLSETREVEFYTEPGSLIGMTGGGMVSYFIQDRTIINLDGLINSKEYFDAMKAGTATHFLDELPLNYAYGKPYMLLESDPYNVIFKDRLKEIGFIRGYENFTLFEYVIQP